MSVLKILKVVFSVIKFIALTFIAYAIYQYLLKNILTDRIHIFLYLLFFFFTAYIILPKITRQITKLYVPNYFIGRTKTVDGLLGDPVNLAFNGSLEDVIEAFERAGWSKTQQLNIKSASKIIMSTLLNKPYQRAPVSSLYLFGEQQYIAFELEIGSSPRKRHHVRLWKVPTTYHLPKGDTVDWFAAATRDDNIGLSLFTGQITHKINANVDDERNLVVNDLLSNNEHINIEEFKYFTDSYNSRNGGGDKIYTDGSLLIITIKDNKEKQLY